MTSIRSIAAAAALAALSCGTALAAPGLTTAGAVMRSGPGPSFPSVSTVPPRAVLDVIGCSDWCKVEHRGRVGWLPRAYVSGARPAPRTGDPVIAVVPAPGGPAVGRDDGGRAVGWHVPRRGSDAVRVYEDRNGRTYYEARGRRHYVSPRDVADSRREAEEPRERRRQEYRERLEERRDRWDRRDDPTRDRLERERDRMEDRRDRDEFLRDRLEDDVFGDGRYR